MTISLPDSIHNKIKELALKDGISIDQFLASAAAEKVSFMLTTGYLEQEAALASRAEFQRILRKVPDAPPSPGDELP